MTLTPAMLQQHPITLAFGSGVKAKKTYHQGTKHHMYNRNQLNGYVLSQQGRYPGTWKLKIGGGADTVFLPFQGKEVTSIPLPTTGASFFVTDEMSGCCFCIVKTGNNNRFAIHANTLTGSSREDKRGRAHNWQHDSALADLAALVRNAQMILAPRRSSTIWANLSTLSVPKVITPGLISVAAQLSSVFTAEPNGASGSRPGEDQAIQGLCTCSKPRSSGRSHSAVPWATTARRLRHERCVWMARETTKWPSTRWPITKIMSSDGCKGNRLPWRGPWYDFHEFGCHLGNVG